MLKERLSQLFANYDISIQKLIADVLILEQAYISHERPHIKDQISQIVSQIANQELENLKDDGE